MALIFDASTSTITHPVTLPGAPYHVGDPILVEHNDQWREGTVTAITRANERAAFGLTWLLRVDFEDGTCTGALCDDDGRNHRYRSQVMGSQRVVA